jgi:hypothetical protein
LRQRASNCCVMVTSSRTITPSTMSCRRARSPNAMPTNWPSCDFGVECAG